MDEESELSEDWLEEAERWATMPAPLAPYWEGASFDKALETQVRQLTSEAERVELYKRLFALIDRDDAELQYQALARISGAFRSESYEDEEEQPSGRSSLTARLDMLLAEVERRLPTSPQLLEPFCSQFAPYESKHCDQIRDWLEHLHALGDACPVPARALLAARIYYGALGATWAEAGERLIAALDHEDLTVRACAAYQIGQFCDRLTQHPTEDEEDWDGIDRDQDADREATKGMALLADYWELIRTKEIERAGVAGAFWNAAPKRTVDADEWLLSLLEQSGEEPYIAYFPCNLGFDAHERYSRDPAAIRRLIDAGRTDIAIMAASEENEPLERMEPLLMELGENEEPVVARLAAWTLAYYYNKLHPTGERLGFVQRYADFPECEMYLLFSENKERKSPYAVVLYPKPERTRWTREEAQSLVDRIFPPAVRGEARQEAYSDPDRPWYQRGYVKFTGEKKRGKAKKVTRITIGYRSDTYWNPIK